MSGYHVGLAFRAKKVQTRVERLVLVALADSADKNTGECYPSHSHLADDAMCSVSSVRRAINSLESYGYISRVNRFRSYGQTTNLYTLNLEGVHSEHPPVHPDEHPPVHPDEHQNRQLTIVGVWGEPPAGINPEAWQKWAGYSGEVHSDTAEEVRRFLVQFSNKEQMAIVSQSIRNGWTGLFEVRGNKNGTTQQRGKRKSFDEIRAEQRGRGSQVDDSGRAPGESSVVATY